MYDILQLNDMFVPELLDIADQLKIPNAKKLGKQDLVYKILDMISLRGILDRIRCPILVIHGENDRQIPLAFAKRVVAECVNSPRAELHVQTLADGGAEHCGIDNVALTREVLSDWIAEALGGRLGPAV